MIVVVDNLVNCLTIQYEKNGQLYWIGCASIEFDASSQLMDVYRDTVTSFSADEPG